MKGKSKKLQSVHSNSTKKLSMRNKSHPPHDINLEKIFSQMKTDILNEMKKVAEIKFNEHKVNILKILNKTQNGFVPKKKAQNVIKSEKKEKKAKIDSDDDIIKVVTPPHYVYPKPKDKDKEKNKKSKKRTTTPNTSRRNKTPSKGDKHTINLSETPKSRNTSTDPKIPKKNKTKKSIADGKNEFLGNKRKRGKENFVNLTHNSEQKTSSTLKKKKIANQPKKPSSKKKVK